ncbi:ATP-binding cassette domain-containing protein [Pyxidicoccus trucidator]|uniref:ATP-binding cassette domain-containing protein n=1 Tax=Pyxidicoccus trucidator TaxID=2709662 RepID=UPI0013DC45D6|nr:ATP-binding cassette domain-containing protein [Pyxidicoccus trucidator]
MSRPGEHASDERALRGRYSRDVFETLFFAYRPMAGRILLLFVGGFFGRLLLLSNANLIGVWADTYCDRFGSQAPCKPVPALFAHFSDTDFLKLLAAATLAGFALTAFFRIGFSRLSAIAMSHLYDEVTLRTSRLPLRFFDTTPTGHIVTRFSSDYANIFRLFGGPLAELFALVFDLACALLLITAAHPVHLPALVVIGVAYFAVYRLNRDRLREERRELAASRAPPIAHFTETTQGASTIRTFGRQATFLERFRSLDGRHLDQRLRTTGVTLRFSMQMSALTSLLLLSTGLLGYWLARKGVVSVGSIGVAFTFIVLVSMNLRMLFEWLTQFEDGLTGIERLDDYLRRKLEPGAKLPATRRFPTAHEVHAPGEEEALKQTGLAPAGGASVTVEDLWFRYAPELPYVLKGLTFSLQPGEKVGIIGRTGSGKTSLVQAFFQLYPLERGRILINGAEPETGREGQPQGRIDLDVFRRSIALISQEPTLIRGTLRENLDFTQAHDDERLVRVLERVGLGEWLRSQPKGLEARLEERGRNLSAGEKQLLCLARCLLQDSPVVVMDEATSSVDPQLEEVLVRATREFFADRTQLIIAHRLSTLAHCDRILWLHKGELRMLDRPEKVLPVFSSAELN